jgi:hypothetical protein
VDLHAVDSVDPSNVLTTSAGIGLQIWSSTTYAPGGDINDGGDWINNGTLPGGHEHSHLQWREQSDNQGTQFDDLQ